MKKFLSLFAIIALLATTAFEADAKRFGGRSSGKTHKTRNVQQQSTAYQNKNNTAPNQQQNLNKKSSSKKSMMGGILGGLLMGGLIGSLLSGDGFDFENFQFMDMLMMAALAFALFKIFKMIKGTQVRSTQPYANAAPAGQPQQSVTPEAMHQPHASWSAQPVQSSATPGFTSQDQDVPMNFPADFNAMFFTNQARDQFRQVQDAWNHRNTAKIKEYVTPELFDSIQKDMYSDENTGQLEVQNVEATLVRGTYDAQSAQVSVQFVGLCIDRKTGQTEDVNDVWHLERNLTQANAPWIIVGMTSH